MALPTKINEPMVRSWGKETHSKQWSFLWPPTSRAGENWRQVHWLAGVLVNIMISETGTRTWTGAGQEYSKGEHILNKVLIPLVLVVRTGVDGVTETEVAINFYLAKSLVLTVTLEVRDQDQR